MSTRGELVFSYGTLRQPEVQRHQFGRTLPTRPAALPGYAVETVTITDPVVIEVSGSDRHPGLVRSDDPAARVPGALLEMTAGELARADEYEVDDYERAEVVVESGERCWAYVLRARV